jgi:hypothetical protein
VRTPLLAVCAAAGLWACASTAAGPTPPPTTGVELKGEWRQGAVIFGQAVPGSTVSFNGRAVRVSPDGRFLIGLDRDEPPAAKLVIAREGAATERREFKVEPRTYDIQRIDGLPRAAFTCA